MRTPFQRSPWTRPGLTEFRENSLLISKGLTGDYNNVVGLPVGRVYQEMKGYAAH